MYLTVGFSTSCGILSAIIRFLTRSPISHTWFGLRHANTELILHADSRGVSIISRRAFEKRNKIIAEFVINLKLAEYIDDILAELDDGYDYAGIIGQLWVLFGRVFGRAWENPLQRDDQWYCSELVSFFLKECGEVIPYKPAQVTPAMLYDLLLDSRFATPVVPR